MSIQSINTDEFIKSALAAATATASNVSLLFDVPEEIKYSVHCADCCDSY